MAWQDGAASDRDKQDHYPSLEVEFHRLAASHTEGYFLLFTEANCKSVRMNVQGRKYVNRRSHARSRSTRTNQAGLSESS